jgi:formamidopyrimidine-DNA glycosylase
MPELPEIESLRRRIVREFVGPAINSVEIRRTSQRQGVVPPTFEGIAGLRIAAIDRRGKLLIFMLSDESALVFHLGMSGRLVPRPPATSHDLFGVRFVGETWLTFSDFRRFGRIWRYQLAALARQISADYVGPEPLSPPFDATAFQLKSRRTVKAVLLDQRIVAGLGNIYSCESLYHARIRPDRPIVSLSLGECRRLVEAIKRVLHAAIDCGGATLNDYRGTEGEAGNYDRFFGVFNREGLPCPDCVCSEGVARIIQGGRSTYFCPVLQR